MDSIIALSLPAFLGCFRQPVRGSRRSTSGFHDLDQAAVAAVQKAALPQKPAELAGLRHLVFHLVFGSGG